MCCWVVLQVHRAHRISVVVPALDVESHERTCWVACSGDEAEWLDSCAKEQPDQARAGVGGAGSSQSTQSSMRSQELEGLSSTSDVLSVPKFVNLEGAYPHLADGN